jgi:outer membrane protein TolC
MFSPRLFRTLRAGCLALMAAIVPVQAQEPLAAPQAPPAQPEAAPAVSEMLTLDRVLELADMKSEPVAIARAGIARSDADIIRARSGLLPQLSATASYDRALASEFDNLFTVPSGPSCAPFALDPSASLDVRVSEIERAIDCGAVGGNLFGSGGGSSSDGLGNLPFGRKNTWRASLSFTQNLYSGGRNGAQQELAAAGRESADLSLTTTRGQLSLDAATAYYDMALSARLVAIAEATLQQADATLRQVQAGFDAGTQPEFEVLRARVNRDSQTPVLIRQRVNRAIAGLRLKQLLDLPATTELQLPDVFADETLPPAPAFAPRIAAVEQVVGGDATAAITRGLQAPLPDRTVVTAAAADLRRTQAALSLAEAQKMPSASINSSYSRVAYPGNVFPTDNFHNNWTVGASVQVPILTGHRQQGDEAVARADVEESRQRLQQTRELSGLDTRLAWAELLAARATWESTAGTVQQATRAYEIAEVRYRAGVSTQLELSDARLQLQQAQASRAQAARDVQVARAHVALLPELPLGTAAGAAAGAAASRTATPSAPAQTTPSQPQTAAGAFQTGRQGAQTGR